MQVWEGHRSAVYAVAFSPTGTEFASGGKDGTVLVHDPLGNPRQFIKPHPEIAPVQAVCFHPRGHCLLFGFRRGWGCRLLSDADKGHVYGPSCYTENGGGVGLAFLDTATFAVGVGDRAQAVPGKFELWNFDLQTRREPRFQEPAGVRAVAAHPPTRVVAWANGSRRVTAWDVMKPDPIHFNQPHNSVSLSFHPDGHLLAATADYGVRVYDVGKRHEVAALKGHSGRVTSVAFSPDGRTLATGSWDGTVRFWDVVSWREAACFRWPVGKVLCLAYAPDGLRLAAGGDKGSIVVWDVE
jgi:WD40 repeat protein